MTPALRVDDFDYDLPPEHIAQEPLARRDASRLMVLERRSGRVEHRIFSDLPDLLTPGDLLVLNDTRVIPARLRGRRASAGTGGRVEALLVEPLGPVTDASGRSGETWLALVKGARREGEPIEFSGGLSGRLGPRQGDEAFRLDLWADGGAGEISAVLESAGVMPVPPYIRREPGDPREIGDRERYQTLFARSPGAVAAPTAGLHFTIELLDAIRARGVAIEMLTLHVGPGTFQPVRVERVEDHRLQAERFMIPEAVSRAVGDARGRGGRIVAVGTTVTRALESRAALDPAGVAAGRGRCDLFIYPGHEFRVVDAMVTNFHLPRSTLLMLVSAFAGRQRIMAAYAEAIRQGYRFYSYGDAMFIAQAGERSTCRSGSR
jgi:S-adenosylmethionine:tRNA ribosyltransferase-isomerase